ncbi:MAG: hypothetical protein RL291_1831 [Pseudomonadota bacterium]
MTGQTPAPQPTAARASDDLAAQPKVLKAEAVRRPAAWYVRRAIFGLMLLLTAAGGGAWLFHSSIEAEAGDGSRFGTYAD